jgi:hypothetical protein
MKQIIKKAMAVTMSTLLLCASFAPLASADTMPQTDTKLAVSKSSKTKDMLYTNKKYGFSLTLPASWKGKYVVKENVWLTENFKSVDFIVYYNNKKAFYSVLSIIVSKNKQDITENPFASYLSSKNGMHYGYICNVGDPDSYLLSHPSVLNMISQMTSKDAPKVAKTFRFIKSSYKN